MPTKCLLLLIASLTAVNAQATRHGTGHRPLTAQERQRNKVVFAAAKDPLPETLDWRVELPGSVTAVKDQGNCGSCWAFATIASVESRVIIAGGPTLDLAEQFPVSCSEHVYDTYGCCGGNDTVFDFYLKAGFVAETCLPYQDYSTYCPDWAPESSVACSWGCPRVTGFNFYRWVRVDCDTDDPEYNIEQIKRALLAGPVYGAFTFYDDFYDYWAWEEDAGDLDAEEWPDKVYEPHDEFPEMGGHAIVIFGWDDARSCWLCKNSWGTDGPFGDGTLCFRYETADFPGEDCAAPLIAGSGAPPTDLLCVLNADRTVRLSWRNGQGNYRSIGVFIDDAEVATLAGGVETYTSTTALSGGVHELSLRVMVGMATLEAVVCSVSVPPRAVRNLQCVPLGLSVALRWENTEEYDFLDVMLESAVIATIPGAEQSFSTEPFAEGGHKLTVAPKTDDIAGAAASCQVLTAPADFAVAPQHAEGIKGGRVSVPILLDFDNLGDGESEGVDGWSYAITHDPQALTLLSVSFDDSDTMTLRNGQGPEHVRVVQGAELLPGPANGFVVSVEVDRTLVERIRAHPHLRSWRDATATYECTAAALDCTDPTATAAAAVAVRQYFLGSPPWLCAMTRSGMTSLVAAETEAAIDIACVQTEPFFVRGFVNPSDDLINIADAVYILSYIFAQGAEPPCLDAADPNDSGRIDIADAVYLLGYLFASAPAPKPPFETCGPDPTPDDTGCANPPPCVP